MLKPSENPPIRWPEGAPIRDFAGQWWVAHTKSRNEKALADDLVVKGVSYFLPMNWKVRKIRGRTIKSLLPLFSGYLFFCGEERHRLEVLRTNRVANLIEVKDQQRLVAELSQIEQAISAGVNLTQHNYIKTGRRVRVIGGALAGLQGIVEKTRNEMRLVLQVDMLGQAASVEIDADMIEPVEENEMH
ncbi:MAG: UpxY family transcription antiterminator [Sedimentisphaerales bacterium]|nr:UpxY family transcription antiterminator [Sedimentisphaerales bacterium]